MMAASFLKTVAAVALLLVTQITNAITPTTKNFSVTSFVGAPVGVVLNGQPLTTSAGDVTAAGSDGVQYTFFCLTVLNCASGAGQSFSVTAMTDLKAATSFNQAVDLLFAWKNLVGGDYGLTPAESKAIIIKKLWLDAGPERYQVNGPNFGSFGLQAANNTLDGPQYVLDILYGPGIDREGVDSLRVFTGFANGGQVSYLTNAPIPMTTAVPEPAGFILALFGVVVLYMVKRYKP